jgi:hypothetical protein
MIRSIVAAAPARAIGLDLRTPPASLLGDATLRLDTAAPTRQTTVFGLPRNMGPFDRALRGVLAATLAGIGTYRLANGSPNKGLSWALAGVAVIPATTAATGYCPLYQVFGVDYSF